ncbi:MAG: RDD family protein [Caldilineaceae bacterium]|nr:RDD family protein [Caldilineaceae bacterium]
MSIRCPQCGNANQERARFCMHCSRPLTQTCPTCNATLAVNARFCQQCGTTLSQPTSPNRSPFAGKLTGLLQPSMLLASRYRITQKLGEGGMAAVYLIDDLRLTGKQWAIKEMSDAALTNPAERQEAVQAFRQEAELLAKLDHPNLPKVVDYFSENNNQYLVMEYIQGQTLEERLVRNRGPLPESQVMLWAEKLCQVLAYLHNQYPPIIFRDLKPSNIMVRTDSEIKLIDFGIARHFKPGQIKDTQAFGTMGYAPPEQHGKGQTDIRSDIYALGATLHHLLTGQEPSLTPFAFERVRRLNPTISPTVEEVIAKAVDIKPALRWQSMEQMHQALRSQPLSVSTTPASWQAPQPAAIPQSHSGTPAFAMQPAFVDPLHLISLPQVSYASYGKRVGAYLIDTVIQILILGVLYFLLIGLLIGSRQSNSAALINCLWWPLLILVEFFYLIQPTAQTGQTFGKRMAGIRVVERNGNPPGMGRALLRYLIGFGAEALLMNVLLLGLVGFLWPLWDKQKQAWHDKIAGTFVVQG